MVNYQVILLDILENVNDKGYKFFNKGYYISMIQSALESLSFETLALRVEKDVAMPQSLSYQIPNGCFNLREIKIYTGECCTKGNGRDVWYKRNFRGGVTSHADTTDPFVGSYTPDTTLLYYGIENNTIYFSASCGLSSRVNMIFNASIAVYGSVPTIPLALRKVTTDMVTCEVYKKLKARDPKMYRPLYQDAFFELNDLRVGSLPKAKMWCQNMDTKSRADLLEYLSKSND